MTDIQPHQNIWHPEIYDGRKGVYDTPARLYTEDKLVELVQKRAEEDGTWCIEQGLVGDNEDVMRKMMAWVSRRENILQCRTANPDETVDWICRDLANATKNIMGTRG